MNELTRLARSTIAGDQYAMGAFVRMSQADVWRLCAALVDADSADDLTQETYLRAIPALARFRGDSSARTWLLSIARRTCADSIRRRIRERRTQSVLEAQHHPTAADPASSVGAADLLDRLDPDRRSAFVLTQILGLSYADAADVCDCPVGTIRSRVARARAELADAVGRADDPAVGGHGG